MDWTSLVESTILHTNLNFDFQCLLPKHFTSFVQALRCIVLVNMVNKSFVDSMFDEGRESFKLRKQKTSQLSATLFTSINICAYTYIG